MRETNSVVPMEAAHYFETAEKNIWSPLFVFYIVQIITTIYIIYWI